MPSISLLARVAVLAVGFTLVVGIQAQVTLADEGANEPPVANPDELNTAEGTAGSTNVLENDTDPDSDPLSIEDWTDGANGSVSCSGSDCVYIPNDPDFSGADSFTYTVSDGQGGTDVGDVAVEVVPTNEEPSASDDALTLAEDTSDSVDVFANDTDDDGDPLAVETLEPTAGNGTVSCTVGGICTYTPEPNFEGFDTFSYTITDGQGGTDTANVEVTVTPVNDLPNAVDDSLVTSEDQMGSLNVRTNDVDIDGDTLLVTTLSPAASHGTVACLGGGGCSYTPVADYSGPDSFQYTISDGHGGTDTATVNITVTPENTPPVADDDAISTLEDTAGATNVLVGDSDVDGDTLSVSTSAPTAAHGTVSCAAGGVCTYTPSANYNGPDSFDYTVSDGRGKSDTGTVTVTVLPGNDAPLAVDDSLSTPEETAGQVDVLPNDTDLEGDSLSVTGSTNGAHGTASCDATTCTYTPALNYTGADTFTYTVSDGNGGTDTGSVSVTVTGVNDAPVADDDSLMTDMDMPGNVSVLVGDTDIDGDTLTVVTPSDPDHGAVTCNATTGLCTYTPDPGYLGADSFTYEVSDGLLTDQGLVSVTVRQPNVAPGCANIVPSKTKLWSPQRAFVLVALSGATDANGDTLTFAITAVTQDEKTKLVSGPGDRSPDAQRVSGKAHQIKLRAERAPKGNGRVYRIVYRVSDGRGGTCSSVEKVGVPIRQGGTAKANSTQYNSFR
ncbi:MAG: Ig-like domain-containing protein [Gaiellaceae bacterium]